MKILILALLTGCNAATFESVVKPTRTTPTPVPTVTVTPQPCEPPIDDPSQSDNPNQNEDGE